MVTVRDGIVYQAEDDGAGGTIYERRDSKLKHTYKIVGKNDANDDSRFATLVGHVATHGGVIEIAGDLRLTSSHVLTNCQGIRGLSGHMIRFDEDGWISINPWASFVSGTSIAINDMPQRSNHIVGAGLTVLTQGEYVAVLSDQEISEDYTRHDDTSEHRPLEIHRIEKMVRHGDGTEWLLSGYVHDEIEVASPRIKQLTDMHK
jgi:hypothetical protein